MALWAKKGLHYIALSKSKCEPFFIKCTRAFSTNVELEPSLHKDNCENVKDTDRKNCAMLIGYQGADYYGVCMTPGQDAIPTVGKSIIKALIQAGYLDESALLSAKSMSQVSRTDTGVSALTQVITMFLPVDVDLDKVQAYLNDNIKIYGLIHVCKRFVPFRFCDARSYLYYIPSYVFSPQTMEMHSDYRISSDTVDKIKRLSEKFLGRKNYHNFTKHRSFHDVRAVREITKIEVLEPIMKDGMELVCIRIEGKSFILNQIRKIVGVLVTTVRGYAPETYIDIALSQQGIVVGLAPPSGLMLENVNFEWYNKKFHNQGFQPIDFSKYEQEVEALKDKILSYVVATEIEYERTKLWVEALQYLPLKPYNKEQHSLDSCLYYDDTLNIIRTETVSAMQATTLLI